MLELRNLTFGVDAGPGKKEILKVVLSEEVVDPDDIEMLQDLIVAATNEAMKQADEANAAMMSKMTGGMGGFPF